MYLKHQKILNVYVQEKKEKINKEKHYIIKIVFFIELFQISWLKEEILTYLMEGEVNPYMEVFLMTRILFISTINQEHFQWLIVVLIPMDLSLLLR